MFSITLVLIFGKGDLWCAWQESNPQPPRPTRPLLLVLPRGIEPLSPRPKRGALSVKLREQMRRAIRLSYRRVI